MASDSKADAAFAGLKIIQAERHVFLCLGPDCCAPEEGLLVWDYLKQALKSRNLPILRTKAGCFRICSSGPWMVVYPEGVWYGNLTVERCERIVAEHLELGKPIEEWVFKTHPLSGGAAG
jgi:(2Fe-2S) ferredoxin